jgi:DUF2914 family protein/tetratricopeptide repeat protein
MLAEAERAASTGDLVSAEQLLKNAAQLQEKELGPSHPDLANTLNNLAIVAETAGRLNDAETLYRRAVAITSTSLPPDDPMVAASRRNLEDFCRAHGRTIPQPSVAAPVGAPPALVPSAAPIPPDSHPSPRVSRASSRAPTMIALGVVALVALTLFIARPWSARRVPSSSTPAAETPHDQAPPAEPARPAPEAVRPSDRSPAPKVDKAPASAAVALVSVQLCRSLSTSDWRCAPAGDSVAPGPLVLYTRVRSPRDGVVVHRWYRGGALLKSAQLKIGANASEGYRTYSRQTVDAGDWRVEVRSAAGDLLHEQRFAVR